ncbi:Imm1 family immunity protein [Streptomyces sp. SAS_281]|uniref:Imm1 family immunity protein n=1 Tax=Streptomyces sp. SAS_281 TaxID=3412744 RepID=UPI00403C698D
MTLKVLGEVPLYLETRSEVRDYLDAVLAEGDRKKASAELAFQIVWDVEADRRTGSAQDNILSIGIDFQSGFAGILWYCDGGIARRVSAEMGHEVACNAWVSMNPTPPHLDPGVVSDLGSPTFFDRLSVLPLSSIYPVVEEYALEGTGFRPTQVQWLKGHYTGELFVEED